MRIKAKIKTKKLDKKLFADIKKLEGKLKAGYPAENPQTHEKDKNGFSALEKSHAINFTDPNFKPYLQISYTKNKIKYQKRFKLVARMSPSKQSAGLEILGAEMVADIKNTLALFKASPLLTDKGCIFGAISYKRI